MLLLPAPKRAAIVPPMLMSSFRNATSSSGRCICPTETYVIETPPGCFLRKHRRYQDHTCQKWLLDRPHCTSKERSRMRCFFFSFIWPNKRGFLCSMLLFFHERGGCKHKQPSALLLLSCCSCHNRLVLTANHFHVLFEESQLIRVSKIAFSVLSLVAKVTRNPSEF